jgi:hypothetical protein
LHPEKITELLEQRLVCRHNNTYNTGKRMPLTIGYTTMYTEPYDIQDWSYYNGSTASAIKTTILTHDDDHIG